MRLPSDWLAVADLVQTFSPEETGLAGLDEAKPVESGSLPAALRRVMVGKFSDFDEYQLAKYNKPKSAAKVSLKGLDKSRAHREESFACPSVRAFASAG